MYNIFTDFKNVSYTKGKFLSDKSYAYDTVFFVSKFIVKFQKGNIFHLEQNREMFNKYIIDMFNRNQDSDGTPNYYLEVLNLFEYAGVINEIQSKVYKIVNIDALNFINERMENAYIFNYLLTYRTFENDGLIEFYRKICETESTDEKYKLIIKLNEKISNINVSVKKKGTVWEKLNTKYALTILNFINGQKYVSREFNIQDKIAGIESISVNVKGTKTYDNLPKSNTYLKKFDIEYAKKYLKDYLFVLSDDSVEETADKDHEEIVEMADLKLDLLELQNEVKGTPQEFSGEQFVENVVRARNAGAQKRFRNNLFKYTHHRCAICGLPMIELLIASHIKPYAKCEEIYDAVNYENGLLLCPMHDALFESARYITIDSSNGEIRIAKQYEPFKDFFGLDKSVKIDEMYLTQERKHYLEWHNNKFEELNK